MLSKPASCAAPFAGFITKSARLSAAYFAGLGGAYGDISTPRLPKPKTARARSETIATLEPQWNEAVGRGEPFCVENPAGVAYILDNLAPSALAKLPDSTAKFTAEELITKRELVRDEIKGQLKTRLKDRNIIVDEFNIINFEFSKNFNDAIEAKVTAEQSALAAKNKLEQIKFEADQKIAEARGKAEAMTIESNALKSNPQILELRALEKWNGTLPQVTGGAIPFINLPK